MDRRSGGNNNNKENNHIGYRNCVNEPRCSCYLTGQESYNKKVISIFEDSYRANLREKRCRRKDQEASAAISDQTFNCSRCSQTCLPHIVQVGHQ